MIVEAKAAVARQALRAMRPFFAWRGRILSRMFLQRSRWYDANVRIAIEGAIDALEAWESGPAILHWKKEIARLDALAAELAEMRRGLDDDDR